jgi:hypothetical protein
MRSYREGICVPSPHAPKNDLLPERLTVQEANRSAAISESRGSLGAVLFYHKFEKEGLKMKDSREEKQSWSARKTREAGSPALQPYSPG